VRQSLLQRGRPVLQWGLLPSKLQDKPYVLRHRGLQQEHPEVLHGPLLHEDANLLRPVVLQCWYSLLRRQMLHDSPPEVLREHMLPIKLYVLRDQGLRARPSVLQ
jgi:hypothetical protein